MSTTRLPSWPSGGFRFETAIAGGETKTLEGSDALATCTPAGLTATVVTQNPPPANSRFTVKQHGAGTVAITGAYSFEDPTTPGSYLASVSLSTAGLTVTYAWDSVNSRFDLVGTNSSGGGAAASGAYTSVTTFGNGDSKLMGTGRNSLAVCNPGAGNTCAVLFPPAPADGEICTVALDGLGTAVVTGNGHNVESCTTAGSYAATSSMSTDNAPKTPSGAVQSWIYVLANTRWKAA